MAVAGTAEIALGIPKITPAPNYELTRDKDDAAQLVDGRRRPFPPWTKRDSVGWKDRSFVQIADDVPSMGSGACVRVRVVMRFAQKRRAGVLAPRRVDFYAIAGDAEVRHAASWVPDKPEGFVGMVEAMAEMDIDREGFVAAVHANGRYLMLDQIEAHRIGACSPGHHASRSSVALSDVRSDSTKRLLRSMATAREPLLKSHEGSGMRLVDLPPYVQSTIHGELAYSDASLVHHGPVQRVAMADESVDLLIAVQAACPPGGFRVEAIVTGDDNVGVQQSTAELYSVDAVQTFSGAVRRDPLVPLRDRILPCAAERQTLLWVRVAPSPELGQIQNIRMQVEDDQGSKQQLDYEVRYVAVDTASNRCAPWVVVWAYPTDLPVWQHRAAVLEMLRSGGVNVQVLPPALLPPLSIGTIPTRLSVLPLAREIKSVMRVMPHASFLLYAAFDRWMARNREIAPDAQMAYLADWTRGLAENLQAENVPPDQWYLYPMDEPTTEDVEKAVRMARAIRQAAPRVKLYVDPIDSRSRHLSGGEIRDLLTSFDLVQPNARLALAHPHLFQSKAAWVYMNPRSPAKDEDPRFYRGIGALAYLLGAEGLGSWSFSDTGKSSAWDDFDGRRPDWAMAYEAAGAPRSSRRWQAFVQGIADFRALCVLSDVAPRWIDEARERLPSTPSREAVAALASIGDEARRELARKAAR